MPRKNTAKILLLSFVLSQSIPAWAKEPVAQADTLRAPSAEGAGLEELSRAMSAPTRIDRVTDRGIQVARRRSGDVIGTGVWNLYGSIDLPEADDRVRNSQERFINPGVILLQSYANAPVVQSILGRLQAQGSTSIALQLIADHTAVADWRPDETGALLRIDATIPDDLFSGDYAAGMSVLSALLLHHAAARRAGYSEREAYHFTIAFYESLTDTHRTALHAVLGTPWIDHGNAFLTFLTDASGIDADLRGIDSLTLEQRARTEPENRDRFRQAAHQRDRVVSWLLRQVRIDLPYLEADARRVLEEPNLERRREAAYNLLGAYDWDVEQNNARELATHLREEGVAVVAGRLSRAFSNQALLFADSAMVPKSEAVVRAIQVLDEVTQAQVFLRELRAIAEQDPFLRQEIEGLIKKIDKLLTQLQPAMSRLRLMAYGAEPASSMAQYRGAIGQLRDVARILRTRTEGATANLQRAVLDAAREGVRRQADAETLAAIDRRFAALKETVAKFASEAGAIEAGVTALESALVATETLAAAYSVQLQRRSRTGSANLLEANELQPKPEQEEALQKLVRLGGHNTYASAELEWVAQCTDLIEAAPLFIYERVIEVDGKHVTVFEVDQEALEQTIRQMADYWARNIEQTIDSEHVVLAREIVVEADEALKTQVRARMGQGVSAEEAYAQAIQEASPEIQSRVALVAAWVAREFDRRIEEVEGYVESEWQNQRFVDRVEALRAKLVGRGAYQRCVTQATRQQKNLQEDANRLRPTITHRRRQLPAFHLLTTEAPGLVEGFIQVVLEEEMALRNVIRGEGRRLKLDLEAEVKSRMRSYEERITAIAERVVQEFGYDVIVESHLQQNRSWSRGRALQQVLDDNLTLRGEVVRIAVLAEVAEAEAKARREDYEFNASDPDHPLVDRLLQGPAMLGYETEARRDVGERYRNISDVSAASEIFQEEVVSATRRLARQDAFRQLAKQHPDWHLQDRLESWYRDRTALARTTARKEVVAAHQLHAKMEDSRYYYGSGAQFQRADGKFRPSGRRKRYHLIYAPSRVNLGKGERESVEQWSQWVGVTDPLAARHAQRIYGLINYNVVIRTIKEAENFKVSENERTALVRAVANAQAYYTQSLGYGDTEDLSYQINSRGGLTVAAVKEGESFQAGPTAGYCIPKDPLFKLLRGALKDRQKLSQIGIPVHLHDPFLKMVTELESHRGEFETEGAFELWMAERLLANTTQIQHNLSQYIEVTGGVIVFHIAKLSEILGMLGKPSLLATRGQDLGLLLWSNWAGEKVTLGGEQVNRSTALLITRDIFELRAEAARLNPDAHIAAEDEINVHLYGPYKGDSDAPSPPDVRDTVAGRVFMDLSDLGEHVAHDLDETGQTIYRANRYGLRLDSNDPNDLRVTRFLAGEFLGITEDQVESDAEYDQAWRKLRDRVRDPGQYRREQAILIDRGFAEIVRRMKATGDTRVRVLEQQFPGHGTVGHVLVTVVEGVSAQDFMTFRSDAKTLLGEVADDVQEVLQSWGISADQMRANAQLQRPLERWVPLTNLSPEELERLKQQVGGRYHPLAFRLVGPGDNFAQDLQGRDVVVFITVHPELLAMAPSQIRDRMLIGRPNSAAAVRDGSVQGRHRVWFDRDIMLWYAAWRGVDQNGAIIRDWSLRDAQGRKAVYRSFGLGEQTWKPLLGTDLRDETARQERRAMRLHEALSQVANARAGRALMAAVARAKEVYAQELLAEALRVEAIIAGEYQQAMQIKGTDKPRDEMIRRRLEDLATGLPLEQFSRSHWLAIGGFYLLHGAPVNQQEEVMATLLKAQQRLQEAATRQASGLEEAQDAAVLQELLTPQVGPTAVASVDRKGAGMSVKASEAVAERAVARLAALKAEAVRQSAMAIREQGFREIRPGNLSRDYQEALSAFGMVASAPGRSTNPDTVYRQMGRVVGFSVDAMHRLNELLITDADQRAQIDRQITALTQGREMDPAVVRAFGGSYEDAGILARWFEAAGDEHREEVAQVVELFYIMLAIEKTAHFVAMAPEEVDERLFWRALTEVFSETIDDHFYEYNPWAYDSKRGAGFREFYDELGFVRQERAEELYDLAWRHHRTLYVYLRELIVAKTGLRQMDPPQRDLLLGRVRMGIVAAGDSVEVQGIGAGAPSAAEALWRQYNQLRETAFLHNDGFTTPIVFDEFDPNDPEILNARAKVNGVFLSPTDRTHYSRARMEAPTLGENIFITRWGRVGTLEGANGSVLQIDDARFWLSEEQYRRALIKFHRMTPADAAKQVARDRAAGRLTPKGIQVAAKFDQPVTVGWVVSIHHHPLEHELAKVGYPYTDKSGVHFAYTYDKSEYPDAYNPSEETGVYLPPEIDWHREETDHLESQGESEDAIVGQIGEWLRNFAQQHRILVIKGSAESGARNFLRVDVASDGRVIEKELERAARFIHQVSKGQNVTVQRAIIVTPLTWMDAAAAQAFVDRQIRNWAEPVNLNRHPKDWVYGTLRVILSAGMPEGGNLFDPSNWSASHPIALTSLQVATNVGRRGDLEILTDAMVRPELRESFRAELEQAGRQVMVATAQYAQRYWREKYAPAYRARYGEDPPEFDASDVPYWWPRYLMIDILPEPIWGRNGRPVEGARVVDVVPGDPNRGTQAKFILEDDDGNQFEGEVLGMRFWLLEPNVGIGLWPNYWRRELVHEQARAEAAGSPVDWNRVGVSARVVLNHYGEAGADFLKKKFGADYFGAEGPSRQMPASPTADWTQTETSVAAAAPVATRASASVEVEASELTFPEDLARAAELASDVQASQPMAPPVRIIPGPVSDVSQWLPHSTTFALVAGRHELMSHNFFSMVATAMGQPVNVIGVASDWLTGDGRARRLMVYDAVSREIVEFECATPVQIQHAQIIELPVLGEVEQHEALTAHLRELGKTQVLNPAGGAQQRADNKQFLREALPNSTPRSVVIPQGTGRDKIREQVAAVLPDAREWVVQPQQGTTGGFGVEVFDDLGRAVAYAENEAQPWPVLISERHGNITYQNHPLVIRVNVSNGIAQSAYAVAGPESAQVASLGREGQTVSLTELAEAIDGFLQGWPAIEQAAIAAERAINQGVGEVERLQVVGVDLVLDSTPEGLRPIILEANARPGGLIFSERIQLAQTEDGPQLIATAGAVSPGFWQALSGLEESGTLQDRLTDPLVSEGVRWRWLTSRADAGKAGWSYEALAKDFLPSSVVPILTGGLQPLLDQEEKLSGPNDRGWRWVDCGTGFGMALKEALASGRYPSLRGVGVDGVLWTAENIPAMRDQLAEGAQSRGIVDPWSWSVPGLTFIQDDVAEVNLDRSAQSPIRLVTIFNTLAFTGDPLGVMVRLYNQLDSGGHLLANLVIPTDHPDAQALRDFYESVVFPKLRELGISADLKITDARIQATPSHGILAGSKEFQLGIVLVKKPGALSLKLTPRAENFITQTTRQIKFQVVKYAGDLQRPFELASGLEESIGFVAQEISAQSPQGAHLGLQWRGVDETGRYSADVPPAILTLEWGRQTPGVDSAKIAEGIRRRLSTVTNHSLAGIVYGPHYVTAAIPQKSDTIVRALQSGFPDKRLALVLGDAPTVDFVTVRDTAQLSIPVVQVAFQDESSPLPDPAVYPNVVRMDPDGAGFDRLLQDLADGTWPTDRAIDLSELVIFSDIDNTVLAALDSFAQQGRDARETDRTARRDLIIALAGRGVDFRFNSGKSLEELSGPRLHSDLERFLLPLVQAAQAAGVSLERFGYDGVSGQQRVRVGPDGALRYDRVEPLQGAPSFSSTEAAAVARLMTSVFMEHHRLKDAVPLDQVQVIPAANAPALADDAPIFVTLVAGEASRFKRSIIDSGRQEEFALLDGSGQIVRDGDGQPVVMSKILAPLAGQPVGSRTIQAVHRLGWETVAVVGGQAKYVMRAIAEATDSQTTYVVQGTVSPSGEIVPNSTEGTGAAFWRSGAIPGIRNSNRLLVGMVGDQALYDAVVLRDMERTWRGAIDDVQDGKPVLVFAAADFGEPAVGKGRVIRQDARPDGKVLGTIEQKDIDAIRAAMARGEPMPEFYRAAGYTTADDLQNISEASVSGYAMRAGDFYNALAGSFNLNAQSQFYVTHLIEWVLHQGGKLRTVSIPKEKAPDITTVDDLAVAEEILREHASMFDFGAGLEEAGTLRTLAQWKTAVGNPVGTGFWSVLKGRYGNDRQRLNERLAAYRQMITRAELAGFELDQPIVVVASPGRNRLMMGHTDSPGLGGLTINAATQEEILVAMQATDDGLVHLKNVQQNLYQYSEFGVQEVAKAGRLFVELETRNQWPSTEWSSYVKGALAYLMSGYFDQRYPAHAGRIENALKGLRILVGSIGEYALPATGGVSSSSALTGAVTVGLNQLLNLGLTKEQLAETDYGEYLLGKTAGAADKTAQLFSEPGKVIAVGSFPEQPLVVVEFPKRGLAVLMASSPYPRYSGADGAEWLINQFGSERGDKIHLWAQEKMSRFGSGAYRAGLKAIRDGLTDSARYEAVGITAEEARQAGDALRRSEVHYSEGLLRDLTTEGALARAIPDANQRYVLIYRLLKLIDDLEVRNVTLYGISEVERGWEYLEAMRAAVVAENAGDSQAQQAATTRILQLVARAHDGDRAYQRWDNGRGEFVATEWAGDAQRVGMPNNVSNETLDQWIEQGVRLADLPGSFQRSIAEIDDVVDLARQRFGGKVQMRIAAAGMGGEVVVYIDTTQNPGLVQEFRDWISTITVAGRTWQLREIKPGAPTQVIMPAPQPAGLEQIQEPEVVDIAA